MSDSVRPHRWQPTRLPHPWDSPGKNTGEGCHFLLQSMKVKSESEVAQSCPTPSDPMDGSPSGSPVPGILQARTLEWGAIAFSPYNCGKQVSLPHTQWEYRPCPLAVVSPHLVSCSSLLLPVLSPENQVPCWFSSLENFTR